MLRLLMIPHPPLLQQQQQQQQKHEHHHHHHHQQQHQEGCKTEKDFLGRGRQVVGDMPTCFDKDLLWDNVRTMLYQEKTGYQCMDYLGETTTKHDNLAFHYQHHNEDRVRRDLPGGRKRVDAFCREQICEWSYRVIDHFRIDREMVSISMSYLDRFLNHCPCDRRTYKLAATTTLYLAVKVHRPYQLKFLTVLSDLSRGEFDMDNIADMESILLQALSWRLHPPTSYTFVSHLLILASSSSDHYQSRGIWEFAIFFTELAACDYYFVTRNPSDIALGSILNAMEGLGLLPINSNNNNNNNNNGGEAAIRPNHSYVGILALVRDLYNIVHRPEGCIEITSIRKRLWELYEKSEECAINMEADEACKIVKQTKQGGGDVHTSKSSKKIKSLFLTPTALLSPRCISQIHNAT